MMLEHIGTLAALAWPKYMLLLLHLWKGLILDVVLTALHRC